MIDILGIKINHIKIDVDGNETLVLKGAKDLLGSSSLKSILIELDKTHSEYDEAIEIIKSYGYEETYDKYNDARPKTSIYNHIFDRT